MYILYVDESGDPGRYNGSNTPHFILSGLVVPLAEWHDAVTRMTAFREALKQRTGLPRREEIHAAELIRPQRAAYKQLRKSDRVQVLRDWVNALPVLCPGGQLLNVCLHKPGLPATDNYLPLAWERLLRAYDAWLQTQGATGLVVADDTDSNALRTLLRTLRRADAPLRHVVEDVFHCSSEHSYFLQAVDAVAYCLYRQEYPKGSTRKFNLHTLFAQLDPMLYRAPGTPDKQGIIRR